MLLLVLKIIFLFYLFLIARLKQRYSIREIKRDLWNIRENYSSNAAIARFIAENAKPADLKTFNYFTLWMGSVHNVPNYVMVGGFFILGLLPLVLCWQLSSAPFHCRGNGIKRCCGQNTVCLLP
ncbi:cytosine permease [Shigella flexneri]